MKLPQSFIDDILSRTDLIDIVSPRIKLKKTGKASYTALCPFHNEKSPSFSVNQAKQFYYCFGCKANGNAIGFLMNYEKLTFKEAITNLAQQAGIPLPEQSKPESATIDFSILEQSASYFQQQLHNHTSPQHYLKERTISAEMITTFRLGYAPPGWENLIHFLGTTAKAKATLLDTGMLAQRDNSTLYDRFRDRLMFPIRNSQGKIIAFGGRSLNNKLPKYLNSPETVIFHKSRELYGLYEALQANKNIKRMIIVEGYIDVISLHQYGFTETVATLGTSISLQHINVLLRYTQHLIFCFDGDKAGKSAAWRALEAILPLMNKGIDIHFLFLPQGEDPDSYIKKVGGQQFNHQLNQATSLMDYFFAKLAAENDLTTPAGKTRFTYAVDKYLKTHLKGIFQELMYERLASCLGLSLNRVQELLKQPMAEKKTEARVQSKIQLAPPIRLALSLLLQSPMLIEHITIPAEFFSINLEGMPLLQKVITLIQQDPKKPMGSLLEYLQGEKEKDVLLMLAAQDLLIPEDAWQIELEDTIKRIMVLDRENMIKSLLLKGKDKGLSLEEKKQLQQLLVLQNLQHQL